MDGYSPAQWEANEPFVTCNGPFPTAIINKEAVLTSKDIRNPQSVEAKGKICVAISTDQ